MSGDYRFSANTGFLWKDRPFLDRLRAASVAGFDAVEFHDEAQSEDKACLHDVLTEIGLPVLGLNVRMGETAGCAAIPARAEEARRDIDRAIDVADQVGARAVHVLAGRTNEPGSEMAFISSLHYALRSSDLTILIEPICRKAISDYFLNDLDQARGIVAEIGHPRLKILFDCYHIHTEHGGVILRLQESVADVGHIQIASPSRNEPECGPGAALDYSTALAAFRDAGYAGPFGCEYRPATTTDSGLGWRNAIGG